MSLEPADSAGSLGNLTHQSYERNTIGTYETIGR